MRYSVKLLLAGILLIAVVIQVTQAVIDKEELKLLEAMLIREQNGITELQAPDSRRKQYDLCEMVLEDSLVPLEAYLATKARFEVLRSGKAGN
jgi:hypothetical protein